MIVDVCSKVGVVIKVSAAVIDEQLHKSVSAETGVSMLNWKFAEKKCVLKEKCSDNCRKGSVPMSVISEIR